MKILANDGISQSGVDALEHAGYEVITTKVAQEQLENYINDNQIDAIEEEGEPQLWVFINNSINKCICRWKESIEKEKTE